MDYIFVMNLVDVCLESERYTGLCYYAAAYKPNF